MILYFKNDDGNEKEIGNPNTYKESNKIITEFLAERNYKSHYRRIWKDERSNECRYIFDVGSHTEFFILVGECMELEGKIG